MLSLIALLVTNVVPRVALPVQPAPAAAAAASDVLTLPGRAIDARVARITFRIVAAGRKRCPIVEPNFGLVLQHLSQFNLADRAGLIATRSLDRGPGVIAVVPGGPGAVAGIRAGDVLLAIDGVALPPEPDLTEPFEAPRAHARDDMVHDLLARADGGPHPLTLLRDGAALTVRLDAHPTCASQVYLARSEQRNAYADGRHVFLTTGVVARLVNDDELAFVIAHELSHDILGHAAMLRAAGDRKAQLVRRTEDEADALAGALMLDAGYDPVTGVEALRRLGEGGIGFEPSADHGSIAARRAAMRSLVAARRGP